MVEIISNNMGINCSLSTWHPFSLNEIHFKMSFFSLLSLAIFWLVVSTF